MMAQAASIFRPRSLIDHALIDLESIAGGVSNVASGKVNEHVLESVVSQRQRRDRELVGSGELHERRKCARARAAVDAVGIVLSGDVLDTGESAQRVPVVGRVRVEADFDQFGTG